MWKQKYNDIKDLIKANWTDPVWSKVIAGVISAVTGTILTTVYVLVQTLIEKVPFSQVLRQIYNFLIGHSSINNFVIILFVATLIYVSLIFLWKLYLKLSKQKPTAERKNIVLPTITETSTSFFSQRISAAFPGQREIVWYDKPKEIVNRLKVVFKEPIHFSPTSDYETSSEPIWWLRGSESLSITEFKILSNTKVLLGNQELEIKRIAVNSDAQYYKSFIYFECKAEKPIGLYNRSQADIKQSTDYFGYCKEEYAIFKNKPITREAYDDGGAIIKGKVYDTRMKAELRVRYLTDYNFIIAAKHSPYNSKKFNHNSKNFFDGILTGKISHVEFFSFLDELKRHEELY